MKTPQEIIKQLEENNSRLAKEAILQNAVNENATEFFDGVRLALDNLITFGVKKVPTFSGPDGQGLPWAAFLELTTSLAHRKLTGNDAKAAIELALSASTADQWNYWYRRILIKDLRCNVSEKTINKVLHDSNIEEIPVFTCQLAHDGANHQKKLVGEELLDYKLDGVRCLTVVDIVSKTVTQFSRNGNLLKNFTHLTDGLSKYIDQFTESVVIDGEVISSDFQTLMTQVNRKEDVDAADAKLMAFDIVPLHEFRKGKGTVPQLKRREYLQSLSSIFDNILLENGEKAIEVVQYIKVNLSTTEGKETYEAFNRQALSLGLEGIMIKDPKAVYECKKGTHWLKRKPSITVDLTIVGLEAGEGKYEGSLGALICEGIDDGKKIKVNVGSGLSDEQRDQLWNSDHSTIIGNLVEIKADSITKSRDSDDEYSLRFPRFERFRTFTQNGGKL